MNKFSVQDVKNLQYHGDVLDELVERICLVEFDPQLVNEQNFIVHTNFIMLEILLYLRNDFLDKTTANHLLNKVDALYDSVDMLSMERIIQKLNSEIVEDMLGIPYFNKIAIKCDDLYVSS